VAGLVPATPIVEALCPPNRDRRDKPGDEATSFAPVTLSSVKPMTRLVSCMARLSLLCFLSAHDSIVERCELCHVDADALEPVHRLGPVGIA
jgi:hypothetical protein